MGPLKRSDRENARESGACEGKEEEEEKTQKKQNETTHARPTAAQVAADSGAASTSALVRAARLPAWIAETVVCSACPFLFLLLFG